MSYFSFKSAPFKTLPDQKSLVKSGLKCELGANQSWEPIPIGWFNNWKKYVDFDNESKEDRRSEEAIAENHPGQIDCSPLQGNFGDEMSRDVNDNIDFVLLPRDVLDKVFEFYGSPNPKTRFHRVTKKIGTEFQFTYQIKLYPTRVELKLYDSVTDTIDESSMKYSYIHDNGVTLASFKQTYINYHSKMVDYYEHYRVWIKLKVNNEGHSSTTAVEHQSMDLESSQVRLVTLDKISTVDGWKLMQEKEEKDINIETLTTERMCIELMIEKMKKAGSGYAPAPAKWESWPRYKYLNAWKQDLRRGDTIDVFRASDKKWLEAIVKSADEEGVEVHYKTYDESEDERILRADFDLKLQPLHSNTINWKSAIEEDDLCDIKVRGVWVQGSIESIDTANNKVQVCYNDALVDHYNSQPAQGAVEGPAQAVDNSSSVALLNNNSVSNDVESMTTNDEEKLSDDDKKKAKMESKNNDDNNNSSSNDDFWSLSAGGGAGGGLPGSRGFSSVKPKPPLELIKEPVVDSVVVAAWFSLDAEDIAYIQTHSRMTHRSRKYLVAKSEKKVSYYDYGDRASKGVPVAAGCVGLQNIGNTCYMNSMLQCLSHAGPLAEIFTSGRYRTELNRDNAVGHGGRLAKSYAQLMKDMYSNNFTTLVPRQFKTTIGQCWNQFANYDQQDSQELMGYLIDGLHEDLNRVQKKPYVQTIRGNGRPDSLVSADSWRRHLLRHDSTVNDIMYGQTKSTVTCANPECRKEHVTFEAFNSLSVPIPGSNVQAVRVLVRLLPADSTPFEVDVQFNVKSGNAGDFKEAIVRRLTELELIPPVNPLEPSRFYMSVYLNMVSSIYENSSLEYIKENKVCCTYYNPKYYRFYCIQSEHDAIPKEAVREWDNAKRDWVTTEPLRISEFCPLLVHSAKKKVSTYAYAHNDIEVLELPVMMCYASNTTGGDVHRMVQSYASKFIPSDFTLPADSSINSLFSIWTCDNYGTKKEQIHNDETAFTATKIAIVWNPDFSPVIPPKDPTFQLKRERKEDAEDSESEGLSVYKCLEKFVEHEQLPAIETYYCNACKQHLAPQKKIDIWATPDVLALHLKRFQYSTSKWNNSVIREKISDHVEYPIRGLDLGRFMVGPIDPEAPPIYDLVGVSLHSGSLYGGHYTAVCKDEASGNFYNFNDSSVSKVEESASVSSLAYVLIYRRRAGSLRWGGIKPTEGGDILPDDP